ncbi:hypothetical protein DL96DRAFT_1583484 [Flagelloscypha sp. PMI_526]|nr:hypothetical protein DL96DRAFT_1583484 [Flagelloscypha sp. PMI_526]
MSEDVFKHLFGYEQAPITSSTTSPPTLRRQTHSELQAGDRLQEPASLSHKLSGCSPVAIPSNTYGGDLPATKYQPYSVPSTHLGCVATQFPFNSLSSVPEGRTSCHPTVSQFLPFTRPSTLLDHHEVYYPINPGAPRHQYSSSHRSSHPPTVSTPKPTRGDKGKRKREEEVDDVHNKQQKLTFTVSGTPRDTECPRCGKYFSASGLGKHLASCRSTIGRQKFAFVPASWRKSEVQATCIMAYTFNQKSLEPEVDNFLRSISGLVPSGSWSGASRNAEIVAFLKTGRYEVQDGATACCWCEKADWDDQSYCAGLASHGPICLVRLRAFQAAGYAATNLKRQSSEPSYHTSISRISSTTPSLACSRSVSVTPTPITPCDSSDTTKPFLDINDSKEGKASKENVPSHPATNDNDEEEEDEWEEVVIPPRVSHQTPAASLAIKRSTQADPVGQTCAEEPTTTTLGARSASRRESDDHHSNRALLDGRLPQPQAPTLIRTTTTDDN